MKELLFIQLRYWVMVIMFYAPSSRGNLYYCPGNYVLRINANICYLKVNHRKEVYWKANEVCMKTNGVLATINDEDTHKYLVSLKETPKVNSSRKEGSSDRYWFGLSDRFMRRKFRWARCQDGWFNLSKSFQKWNESESNKTTNSEKRCVSLVVSEKNLQRSGWWDIEKCSTANYFICQIEAKVNYTAVNSTVNMEHYTPAILIYNASDAGVTEEVIMTTAQSPLGVILIVIIFLVIFSIALGLWYHKRHRDSLQRNLIAASGMPNIGGQSVLHQQPFHASIPRHFSNNSNRVQFLPEAHSHKTVYCGQNIDVIEEDEEPCGINTYTSALSPYNSFNISEVDIINSHLTPVESVISHA